MSGEEAEAMGLASVCVDDEDVIDEAYDRQKVSHRQSIRHSMDKVQLE